MPDRPDPLTDPVARVLARFTPAAGLDRDEMLFRAGRAFELVPTRANGQPAFGVYVRAPTGGNRYGTGLYVLSLAGDQICAITRFESRVLQWFGLPQSLPG